MEQSVITSITYFLKALVLFLLFLLFHFFIFVPIACIRLIVICLSFCVPNLGRMLSHCSSMLAIESETVPLSKLRSTCTLMPVLMLDGQVDFMALRCRMEELIQQKVFAELRQSLTKFCGFYFWKRNENFSLDDHLSHIDKPISHEQLQSYVEELQVQPYEAHRPLWSVTVFSNLISQDLEANGRVSAVLVRVHHALADGYSILRLIDEMGNSKEVNGVSLFSSLPKPDYRHTRWLDRLVFWSRAIFFGPVEMWEVSQKRKSPCKWTKELKELSFENLEDGTDELKFDDVKNAARILGVPTSALIFSSYAGVIRKTMMDMGETVPRNFAMTIPLPIPGHPQYLTNYMMLTPVFVPLEIAEPLTRLLETKRRFDALKNSSVPLGFHYISRLLGNIAGWGIYAKVQLSPGIFNNFPGPRKVLNFLNVPMTTFKLAGGIPLGAYTALFCSHSYGDRLILRVAYDKSLYKDQDIAKTMLNNLLDELKNYMDMAKSRGIFQK